jgi:hypothetical protein
LQHVSSKMVNSAWAGHARWVCSRAGGTRTLPHPPPPGSQVACPSLPLLPPLGRFEHTHPTPFSRRVHSTTEGHLGVHPLFWGRVRSEGGARCSKCAKTPAVQCRWTAVHGERGSVCPGDAKSSLGDAKSSLGDAESSLGFSHEYCQPQVVLPLCISTPCSLRYLPQTHLPPPASPSNPSGKGRWCRPSRNIL